MNKLVHVDSDVLIHLKYSHHQVLADELNCIITFLMWHISFQTDIWSEYCLTLRDLKGKAVA